MKAIPPLSGRILVNVEYASTPKRCDEGIEVKALLANPTHYRVVPSDLLDKLEVAKREAERLTTAILACPKPSLLVVGEHLPQEPGR